MPWLWRCASPVAALLSEPGLAFGQCHAAGGGRRAEMGRREEGDEVGEGEEGDQGKRPKRWGGETRGEDGAGDQECLAGLVLCQTIQLSVLKKLDFIFRRG